MMNDETLDAFLGGRFQALQPKNGFRAGTDTVFLAASIGAKEGDRVLELGAGSGVGLLCLGIRQLGLELFGVELIEANANRANANIQRARLQGEIVTGDIFNANLPTMKDQYDHAFMNPPFFVAGAHSAPQDQSRSHAHIAQQPIGAWIKTGLKRVRAKGTLTLIAPSAALKNIFAAISDENAITILPIITKSGENPKRVIVKITTQSKQALKFLAPLIIRDSEGNYTQIGEAISRKGAPIWLEDGCHF